MDPLAKRRGRPYPRDKYESDESNSTNRLYVGNLPHHIDEAMLGDYFAQIGLVQSVRIAHDRITGNRKGYAFVKMASEEEVEIAISELDGREWEGRRLTVNRARPPKRIDTEEYFERHFNYHKFRHNR